MKHFILISIITLMCISCNNNTPSTIPIMEYGDCESNTIYRVNYIAFDLSNILRFQYDVTTNDYYIEYSDPDAFEDYIIIYVSKKDFINLLKDFRKRWNTSISEKWTIKEEIISFEGESNYTYSLI